MNIEETNTNSGCHFDKTNTKERNTNSAYHFDETKPIASKATLTKPILAATFDETNTLKNNTGCDNDDKIITGVHTTNKAPLPPAKQCEE